MQNKTRLSHTPSNKTACTSIPANMLILESLQFLLVLKTPMLKIDAMEIVIQCIMPSHVGRKSFYGKLSIVENFPCFFRKFLTVKMAIFQ